MADFVIHAASPRPARACFDQLINWDAHSAAVPLTTLQYDGTPWVGQRVVARTGWGRLGFDDAMVVQTLDPPAGDLPGDQQGVVEMAKQGRVVGGSVRWTVTPTSEGSDIVWSQHMVIGWLPRWMDPLVGAVGRIAYGMGLRRLLG